MIPFHNTTSENMKPAQKQIPISSNLALDWGSRLLNSPGLLIGIMIFGAALRIARYLHGTSLYFDEAMLGLNLIKYSYWELLRPLDFGQVAPPGFLWLARASVVWFGSSENALRLVPLLAGLVSLPLFYGLARQFLARWSSVLALLLFSVSWPLIRYATEVKQYSLDVAVTLALSLIALKWPLERPCSLRSLAMGLVGAISLWFSHAALFVLAGLAWGWIISAILYRQPRRLLSCAIPFALWAASFTLFFHLFLSRVDGRPDLLQFHADAFAPLIPHSLADLRWFVHTLEGIFINPVGLSFFDFGLVFAIMGVFFFIEKGEDRIIWLVLPVLFALAASALHKYPFRDRLILFTVPVLIILIFAGIQKLFQALDAREQTIKLLLVGIMLASPCLKALGGFARPVEVQALKPALLHISQRARPGDALQLESSCWPGYLFYTNHIPLAHLGPVKVIPWSTEEKINVERNHLVEPGRKWFLFSYETGEAERKLILHQLDSKGKRLDSYEVDPKVTGYLPTVTVYLYDFGLSPP